MAKKMGRPTIRKKDTFLKVRMSQSDLDILDELAILYKVDRSTLVRNVLWYFIDTNTLDIVTGKVETLPPILDMSFQNVQFLYDELGNDDEYFKFREEMQKRKL